MTWLEALILGLVQGVTEFLPVSSSGHLRLVMHVMQDPDSLIAKPDHQLFVSVFLHGCTLMAILWAFRKEAIEAVTTRPRELKLIFIGTLPTVVYFFGLRFEDIVKHMSLFSIGWAFMATAVFLLVGTFFNMVAEGRKRIQFNESLLIGVAQALAMVPGASRSGFTIAAGLTCGIKRDRVVAFSFLLSIVVISAAMAYETKKLIELSPAERETLLAYATAGPLIFSGILAFVSGLLSIKFLKVLVEKQKMWIFSIYCFAAALFAFYAG